MLTSRKTGEMANTKKPQKTACERKLNEVINITFKNYDKA
jgi:hypothetical protein